MFIQKIILNFRKHFESWYKCLIIIFVFKISLRIQMIREVDVCDQNNHLHELQSYLST